MLIKPQVSQTHSCSLFQGNGLKLWKTAKEVFKFFFNCNFFYIAAANTVGQTKPDTSDKKLEPATEVRQLQDNKPKRILFPDYI